MTFGQPPFRIVIPLPSGATWRYWGAVLAVLSVLAPAAYWLVQDVGEIQQSVAANRDIPERVATVERLITEAARRLDSLETNDAATASSREGRYLDISKRLQQLSDRLDAHADALGAIRAELEGLRAAGEAHEANILNALQGRPFTGADGRRVR